MKMREAFTRNRVLVLVGVALLLVAYWGWPRAGLVLITLEDGDEQWAENLTFAAGQRAIGPTIDCMRERYSGLSKGKVGWVRVLRRFGEPAHQELLCAAAAERTAGGRGRLISALVNAFADYQMVPLWVDDLVKSRIPLYVGHEMTPELRRIYLDPEMPDVIVPGDKDWMLNGDFVLWWNKLSDAQKTGEPLPKTGPASGPTTTAVKGD
jgi:hypothetical protein